MWWFVAGDLHVKGSVINETPGQNQQGDGGNAKTVLKSQMQTCTCYQSFSLSFFSCMNRPRRYHLGVRSMVSVVGVARYAQR